MEKEVIQLQNKEVGIVFTEEEQNKYGIKVGSILNLEDMIIKEDER